MREVNHKLRKAIENEGRIARIEGSWWQDSLTERGPGIPTLRSWRGPARFGWSPPIFSVSGEP
jgi:hypothetical protein